MTGYRLTYPTATGSRSEEYATAAEAEAAAGEVRQAMAAVGMEAHADGIRVESVESVVTVEVSQSADTKRYSVITVGGTGRDKRLAAQARADEMGIELDLDNGWTVTRPHGTGILYGEVRVR